MAKAGRGYTLAEGGRHVAVAVFFKRLALPNSLGVREFQFRVGMATARRRRRSTYFGTEGVKRFKNNKSSTGVQYSRSKMACGTVSDDGVIEQD